MHIIHIYIYIYTYTYYVYIYIYIYASPYALYKQVNIEGYAAQRDHFSMIAVCLLENRLPENIARVHMSNSRGHMDSLRACKCEIWRPCDGGELRRATGVG